MFFHNYRLLTTVLSIYLLTLIPLYINFGFLFSFYHPVLLRRWPVRPSFRACPFSYACSSGRSPRGICSRRRPNTAIRILTGRPSMLLFSLLLPWFVEICRFDHNQSIISPRAPIVVISKSRQSIYIPDTMSDLLADIYNSLLALVTMDISSNKIMTIYMTISVAIYTAKIRNRKPKHS